MSSIEGEKRVRVKTLGERNSGTNYLGELLRRNFRVQLLRGTVPPQLHRLLSGFRVGSERVRDLYFLLTRRHNLGWKHAMAPGRDQLARSRIARDTAFVAVAKNPYAWLLSMYRRPYHVARRSLSFEAFLATPWPTVGRERHPAPFASPIEMWNEKNRSYLDLRGYANAVALAYESVLEDPLATLVAIESRFGLTRCGDTLTNVERATKGDDAGFGDYRDYYLNRRWREKLTDAQVRMINDALDESVMAGFGYRKMD